LIFKKKHIEMILEGRKTATRRRSQHLYRIGGIQGIRSGWYEKPRHHIRITRRYRQRLGDMTQQDAQKEGYPTLEEFKKVWEEINGKWDPDEIVWVYEFIQL